MRYPTRSVADIIANDNGSLFYPRQANSLNKVTLGREEQYHDWYRHDDIGGHQQIPLRAEYAALRPANKILQRDSEGGFAVVLQIIATG